MHQKFTETKVLLYLSTQIGNNKGQPALFCCERSQLISTNSALCQGNSIGRLEKMSRTFLDANELISKYSKFKRHVHVKIITLNVLIPAVL